MAILKDTVVSGNLRVTDSAIAEKVQTKVINAPTSSGGSTYGPGSNGQVLKSNGTTVYWAGDNNSVTGVKGNAESSYRTGQVNLTSANVGAVAVAQGSGNAGKFLMVNSSGNVEATSVTTQATKTWTPTTSNQTIAAGTYITGAQTIAGDADLTAANIKKGVNIFGVTGTFTTTPSGKTALTAASLRSGYAGFINGSQVNGSMADTTVTEGTTTVSGTTATRGTWSQTAGYTASRTVAAATFANSATSGTTYVDISSTTSAPVLVAGDYLYINKGYTDALKISLAKLVPDGSDVKGHGEYILSGHSAYDNDGTLVAGTIPTIASTDLSVSGKTVTVPVGYYTGASGATAVTASVADGAYSASVASQGTNTAAAFTPSTTGTITNITTTTAPSGTDGTDYWTITPSGSKTTGKARAKATATIGTAGYIATGSTTTASYTTWDITTNVNAGTNSYIPKAVITGSSTNATATTTVAPGTVSISKQSTPSGVTNAASGNATTTAPSSGVYVAVKATAAANSTGTTSAINGSGSATVSTAGYAPANLTGTVTVTGSATAKTSAKDSSMTYVPITTATPAFDGGALSGGSTATSSQITMDTTTTTAGVQIQTAYTASSGDVLYNGAVAGWVSKADNAVALAGQSKASTNGTKYYVTKVTVPKDKQFTVETTADTALDTSSDLDITNNAYRRVDVTNKANGTVLVANSGNSTITSGSATAGNLTVSAYNSSGTAENNKSIVSAGKWVATSVSASGTYYGRVTVGAGSVTPAVNSHSITTVPAVTGAISGTVTNIGTTTKPSGTDGTNYWTITPSGSVTTTGVSTANAKATVSAGYIGSSPANSNNSTVNITPTVTNGSARYIVKGTITNNTSGGTSTATINRGKQIKIGAGYYPSDLYYTAQNNSGTLTIDTTKDATTNISCNGYANVNITGINVPAGKSFSVKVPNGGSTATFVFNVDASGNTTITES